MDTTFIPETRTRCANCGIDLLDDTSDEPDREMIRLLYEDDGGYYCEACWFHEPYGSYTETGDKIVDNPRYGTVETHELEEGEYVYVEYKSAYSTERQHFAGEVIRTNDYAPRVTIDTHEETPDGDSIVYRLNGTRVEKYYNSGCLRQLRRVSHRYGSRLAIYRLDESDVVLPDEDDEVDAVLVADGGEELADPFTREEVSELSEGTTVLLEYETTQRTDREVLARVKKAWNASYFAVVYLDVDGDERTVMIYSEGDGTLYSEHDACGNGQRLSEVGSVVLRPDPTKDVEVRPDGGEGSEDERMEYCEACEERVPEDEAQSVQMTMGSHHEPPEYVTLCDSCYADLKRESEEQARAEKEMEFIGDSTEPDDESETAAPLDTELSMTLVYNDGSYSTESITIGELLEGEEIDLTGYARVRFEDADDGWFSPGDSGDLGRGFVGGSGGDDQ